MPVSVFEVTMAAPDEVCLEIRDAPITHGSVISNNGVSIALTSAEAYPIVGVSASPVDGSIRITCTGNPFAAWYMDTASGNAGLVGVAGVSGVPNCNGSWDTRRIDNNTADLLTSNFTGSWTPGTGKLWDYQKWTTYTPAGRRGWLCGPNTDYFRSCDVESAAYLNRSATAVAGNWASFGGRTVTAVYSKHKNYDHGYVDDPIMGQYGETASLKHFIHLKLDGNLAQGGPYTIANATAGISTSFTFNDRTTRAIALHVTGVGHRPNDASKYGYLSLWRPGASAEGAVNFATTHSLTQFEVIDSTNATVAGPFTMVMRINATEPEQRLGVGVDNILGGYPNIAESIAYNSTDPTKVFNLTFVSNNANPAVFTTASPHGFSVGDKARLEDMGGDGAGLFGMTHVTIKIATVPTSTTFTATFSQNALWDANVRTDGPMGYGTTDPYANWIALSRTGKVCKINHSNRAGTFVWGLDYSSFTPSTAGTFRLRIAGLGVSDPFPIGVNAWNNVAAAMFKGEYHHRWGMALDGRFGTTRPASFVDGVSPGGSLGRIHQSKMPYPMEWGAPLFGVYPFLNDVSGARPDWLFPTGSPNQFYRSGYGLGGGSWADAGDWCTRLSAVAGACWCWCELALLRPISAANTNWNVPKISGMYPTITEYANTNDLPELVHQAVFGMEGYRRMQYGAAAILPEGSVPGGLMMDTGTGTTSMPSYLTAGVSYANAPDQMSNFYYVMAAGKIAALMYKYGKTAAGDLWKNSATKAWDWAELLYGSTVEQVNYYEGVLGIRTRTATDSAAVQGGLWSTAQFDANLATLNNAGNSGIARTNAAAVMYRLTGLSTYKTIIEAGIGYVGGNVNNIWFDQFGGIPCAAWEYSETPGINSSARAVIRAQFEGGITRTEAAWEHMASPPNKAPFRSLMLADGGLWNMGGQGIDISGITWGCICAHICSGDTRHLKILQDGMAFIYGANSLSMSSVAQVGNRWPGTIYNEDSLMNGVEAYAGIGCYFYHFLGQWAFMFGTWKSTSNAGCIESPDPRYAAAHIMEREVDPGRYTTPIFEAVWESHFQLDLMERSVQQDVFPLQNMAFYLSSWDEVSLPSTTTALVSSLNPAGQGVSVTFTATVAGGSSPTGSVSFLDSGSTIGSASLSGGVATLAIASLTAGTHSINAVYSGDNSNASSTSNTITQVVSSAAVPIVSARVLDFGLSELADIADKIYLCSAEPTTYAEATSTYALGVKDFGSPGGAFGSPTPASPNGRRVASIAVSDGVASVTGTAVYWAAVDSAGSRLLVRGPLATLKSINAGDIFTMASFDITEPAQ